MDDDHIRSQLDEIRIWVNSIMNNVRAIEQDIGPEAMTVSVPDDVKPASKKSYQRGYRDGYASGLYRSRRKDQK